MPDFIPYTRRNLDYVLSLIESCVYTPVAPLEIKAWRTPEPVAFADRQSGEPLHLKPGDRWGGLFDCAWFHFTGLVPPETAGQALVLLLDVNGEMLAVDQNGLPLRGLTNGSSVFDFSLGRPGKWVLPLPKDLQGGDTISVWADAGCNDLFGNLSEGGTVKQAEMAVCNEEVRGLYFDYQILLDFLTVLQPDSPRYQQVLTALSTAAWKLSTGCTDVQAREARAVLAPLLAKQGGDPDLNITAIGHAHIDLAWLWPLRETYRKGARTFATVLENIERYPNYIYGASQPQLYQWMKDMYPELYQRIKAQVDAGRIEPQGAMWVEADTNVTGGEALVRQVLLGKRFFQQEFGVDINYLWLPDVFGYSGALPQILKKAGVDYFMTQKMSWNQINKFPHHSFYWQGIDGTAVLSHMLPEETYNSAALPSSVRKIEKNYFDKGVSDQCLMLFGIGDGGGGPGEEHLERLERIRNLSGLPPVTQATAASFFPRWVKDAARFPTWVGELYLERHSGTLTTQAKNKRYNRLMEQTLRELEWTAVMAGGSYPSERLNDIWREVLLYQFHDILPGSSIKRVYDESVARYRTMHAEVDDLICRAEESIAREVNTADLKNPVVLFNSLSWQRTEWCNHAGRWQKVTVPPMGYAAVDLTGESTFPTLSASDSQLENDLLRVTFGLDGSVISVFDKECAREVIPQGQPANRLAVYRDPGDAWDFPLDYAQQTPRFMRLHSAKAWVDGPRAVLEQIYCIGASEVVQEIVLTAGSRRLDFNSRVHWRERESMLRTSFPVAVHADEAAYDIQFGHLRRSTHRNTTWDLARDEVAAHKWVDLSQQDYGAALLNDCKYGHRVKDNVIDLNLLRSVPFPGYNTAKDLPIPPAEAHPGYTDQDDHVFSYAFFPHPGDRINGDVNRSGYAFNFPLRAVQVAPQTGSRPAQSSFLTVDAPNVVVEAVKQAEDDPNAVIVRLYESCHAGARANLRFGFPVSMVEEADLMERAICPIVGTDGVYPVDFKPFEIKTLKVSR